MPLHPPVYRNADRHLFRHSTEREGMVAATNHMVAATNHMVGGTNHMPWWVIPTTCHMPCAETTVQPKVAQICIAANWSHAG